MSTLNTAQLQTLLATQANLQSMTDAQAATALSTPSLVPVPYTVFQTGMMQLQCWGAIRAAADNSQTPANVLALCLTAIDLLTNYRGATVDMSLPAFQSAMSGLAAAGLVSSSDQAAILAMGQVYPAGAAVQTADVTAARAVNAQQATVQRLAGQIEAAHGAGLTLVNAYANGPASGTPPTAQQIQTAMSQQITG